MDSLTFSTPKRRTQLPPLLSPSSSLSSSSSSPGFSSYFSGNNSPLSPSTPLQFSHRVPFSWEKLPGIPKKQTPPTTHHHHRSSSSLESLLPLPPPTNTSKRFGALNDIVRAAGRKSFGESARMDPFFAALVECSKDDYGDDERDPREDRVWKTRHSNDLFGLFMNLNVSCKRACAVSESIVYLPRQTAQCRRGGEAVVRRGR